MLKKFNKAGFTSWIYTSFIMLVRQIRCLKVVASYHKRNLVAIIGNWEYADLYMKWRDTCKRT